MDDVGGTGNGFGASANGDMMMCNDCGTDSETGNAGMVVYIHNTGTFNVGANGSATLVGSALDSPYKGILFFESHTAPPNTGLPSSHTSAHRIGGGGALSLTGTIYITNTTMTATAYQAVQIWGNGGNTTTITGEIIVSELELGGTGEIHMFLDPNLFYPVTQLALVQ
jgi:hypothetical protein